MSLKPDSDNQPIPSENGTSGATEVLDPPKKKLGRVGGQPIRVKTAGTPQKPRAAKLAAKRANPDPIEVDWSIWPKESIPIDSITTENRFRKVYHNIPELWESIQKVGQLQPILVGPLTDAGTHPLIAGGRRLEALKHGGRINAVCVIADYGSDPDRALELFLNAELAENEMRENFTFDEKMALVHFIEDKFKTGGKGKAGDKPRRDKVAAVVGLSHETVRQAKIIEKAAKEEPEKFGHLLEGLRKNESTVRSAFRQYKTLVQPQIDAAGLTLPDDAKACESWSALPAYEELAKTLEKCRSTLNAVANSAAGQQLVASGRLRATVKEDKTIYWFDGLKDLLILLRDCRPYAQCPTCAEEHGVLGKYSKKCPTCKGSGFVSETQLKAMTEAHDKAVGVLKKLATAEKNAREVK